MTDERRTKAGLPERAHHAGEDKPAAPRQRRMSAKKKQEAVLRVLRGEDLEVVSREIGTTAADLSGWRDSFLEGGAASLKSRPEADQGRELKAMRESCPSRRHGFEPDGQRRDDDGQRVARGQDRSLGGRHPFSDAEVEAMSRAFSISARRRYGLALLCLYWRVSRATLHRHLKAANRPDAPRRRRGPQGAMPDAELAERIRTLLADSPFHGDGVRRRSGASSGRPARRTQGLGAAPLCRRTDQPAPGATPHTRAQSAGPSAVGVAVSTPTEFSPEVPK